MRFSGALLLMLLPAFAWRKPAASPQIMTDVKSGDFTMRRSAGAATGDPLMEKLVTFFRLTVPGGGTADEIQSFITANPDWPEQGLLALRQQQASGHAMPQRSGPATPAFPHPGQTPCTPPARINRPPPSGPPRAGRGDAAATPDQQLLFWPAQDKLARALLAAGDAKDAYEVVIAVDPPIAGATARGQIADRDFLAGFSAPALSAAAGTRPRPGSPTCSLLHRRHHPGARLLLAGPQRNRRGRAGGLCPRRALSRHLLRPARRDGPGRYARRSSPHASTPTASPAFTAEDALNFALMELPRAAALLMQMNDPHDAQIFLNRARRGRRR